MGKAATPPQDENEVPFDNTPPRVDLTKAAYFGDTKTVNEIIKENPDQVNEVDQYKNTALQYACQGGFLEITKTLVAASADVSTEGYRGLTALHFAAQRGDKPTVEYLLKEADASHSAEDDAGNTPLHLAARNGNLRVLELLVNKGASPKAKNKNGGTPLTFAEIHNQTTSVDFLKSL